MKAFRFLHYRAVFGAFVGLWVLQSWARSDDKPDPKASAAINELARYYKIQIKIAGEPFELAMHHGTLRGKQVTEKNLAAFSQIFIPEFKLYPRKLVAQTGLRRIVLCQGLTYNDKKCPKCAEYERREIFVDISVGLDDRSFLQTGVHHEFFHLVDFCINPDLKAKSWTGLNPARFRYGSDGKDSQDPSYAEGLSDKFPGFVNAYSTTDESEDRAEVFAALIVESTFVSRRTKEDPVLQAKVEWIKKELGKWCPDVNEAFWSKAQGLNRAKLSVPTQQEKKQ